MMIKFDIYYYNRSFMFNIEGVESYLQEWHLIKNHKIKMRTEFNKAVSERSGVEIDQLERMSVGEIAEKVILPKILCEVGCPNFGLPRFMRFMAEWGTFIYSNDHVFGGLLLEIGMQRLSKGALLHEGVNLIKILPREYQKYTFAYEEYRIMTKECYDFLTNNMEVMFCYLEPKYREHCHKIVFGIMQHIDENGQTDLLWNDEIAGHTVLELRDFVKPYATTRCSEMERWEYVGRVANNAAYKWVVTEAPYGSVPVQKLAETMIHNWERVDDFYRDFYNEIDWRKLKKMLDLDKYSYYTGFSKKVLKLFGLYDWMTWQAMKADIRM